jgi:thiamine-phosphate pyrophosphorylase
VKAYAIANVDDAVDERFFTRVADLTDAGVDLIQLRAKTLPGRELFGLATRMRAITAGRTSFLVNARADVAIAAGADGVHLPARGMPVETVRSLSRRLVIGRSCHSPGDVAAATAAGCDYVLLGPVFDTRSKPGSAAISRSDLVSAAAGSCDVYALGGVSLENLEQLRGTGIAGVAGITLFMRDEPVGAIVEAVRAI